MLNLIFVVVMVGSSTNSSLAYNGVSTNLSPDEENKYACNAYGYGDYKAYYMEWIPNDKYGSFEANCC